jgi:hypothetical protein
MAKKSKVKSVSEPTKYDGKNGTVYYFNIKMENGDTGNIGKKTIDGIKPGDELNYTIEETPKGNKIKLEQTTFGKAYTKAADNEDYQRGMMVGASLNNACLLCANGKIESNKIEDTARWLCQISIKLKEEFKT